LASQFIQPHMSRSFIWLLVILVCFHPSKSMP
jgi:hypothetical protein